MPALTFTATEISVAIFKPDTGAGVPLHGVVTSATRQATVGGDDPGDVILLTKAGGAAWLTVPATCDYNTPFDVTIDASALRPGDYTETVTASYLGHTDGTLTVRLAVRPGNAPAPKR